MVIVSESQDRRPRARLETQRSRLTDAQIGLYFLETLIDREDIDIAMPARPTSVALDPDSQRKLGIDLFNYVWTLLETEVRTERESERMIDAAHASRFFWEPVGEPTHHARGEWQISRAYATVGRADPALHYARRCLSICEEHGIGDFDLAYAYEALSRACAAAGERDAADSYRDQAYAAAEQVANEEDRELLLSDLASLTH